MEEKAANPTLETKKRHAGLDPASSGLDPGLRRDDGNRGYCFKPALKSQKGMTLVEVLVAVAILSIGLLAIASMQKTAIMVNMRAFDITEAANVAQSQLELLNSLSLSDPYLTNGSPIENCAPGYDCIWNPTLNSPVAGARLINLAVIANGDTTTCGNGGICDENVCDSSSGSGSTISCYDVVGVKTTRP